MGQSKPHPEPIALQESSRYLIPSDFIVRLRLRIEEFCYCKIRQKNYSGRVVVERCRFRVISVMLSMARDVFFHSCRSSFFVRRFKGSRMPLNLCRLLQRLSFVEECAFCERFLRSYLLN